MQSRIIRQFERLGVTPADPLNYSSIYGNSLLETEQLLTQIRELGITEDLVCTFNRHKKSFFNTFEILY